MAKYSIELLRESLVAIKRKNRKLAVALVQEAITADVGEKNSKQTKKVLDKTSHDLELLIQSMEGNSKDIGEELNADSALKKKAETHLDDLLGTFDEMFDIMAPGQSSRRIIAGGLSKEVTIKNIVNLKKEIDNLSTIAEDNNDIFGDEILAKEIESKMNIFLKQFSVLVDDLKKLD